MHGETMKFVPNNEMPNK